MNFENLITVALKFINTGMSSYIYKVILCNMPCTGHFFCPYKAGEFQNAETVQEPISCSKSRCLRLPSQLVPKEIHFFSPLTINQCFALVLAGTALSVVVTVTVVGLLCVQRVGNLF